MRLGITALRTVVGGIFFAHGAQKLFGWFGGPGPDGTAKGFEAMGLKPGKRNALIAGTSEAAGGTMLATGFLTPLGSAAVIGVMTQAIRSVHRTKGFFVTQGGFEYTGILGLSGAALALGGPGHYSLDRLLGDRFNQRWMAVAALAVFGSASAAIIARRAKALESSASTSDDQVAEGEEAEATGA